jgi:hypothetical protein
MGRAPAGSNGFLDVPEPKAAATALAAHHRSGSIAVGRRCLSALEFARNKSGKGAIRDALDFRARYPDGCVGSDPGSINRKSAVKKTGGVQ